MRDAETGPAQAGPAAEKGGWAARMGRDPSALALIGANLLTIVIALAERWPLGVLMWVYWGQSIVLGVSNFIRIMRLRQFSTAGMTVQGRSVKPTRKVQRQTAFFFAAHYGFFHLIYAAFLASLHDLPSEHLLPAGICVLAFLLNHLFSLAHNWRRDLERKPNLGRVMFFPYARIVPMHLTIIFGSVLGSRGLGVIFFLFLKALADLGMHAAEHRRSETSG